MAEAIALARTRGCSPRLCVIYAMAQRSCTCGGIVEDVARVPIGDIAEIDNTSAATSRPVADARRITQICGSVMLRPDRSEPRWA